MLSRTLAAAGFALEMVSRGLAIGDVDNNGELDIPDAPTRMGRTAMSTVTAP